MENLKDVPVEVFEFYQNKSPKVKGILLNNLKEGEWIEYFENGNPRRIVNYHKGLKIGKAYVFKESGELDFSMEYKSGILVISPKFKRQIR
jgi:antitoxin component YwqK of YwqJK toxin-antitoxin module